MLSDSLALEPATAHLAELTVVAAAPRDSPPARRPRLAGGLARRRRARRRGDPGRARSPRGAQRAGDRGRAGRAAARDGDPVRRLLDAGARDRDVLAGPRRTRRACCATAAQTGSTGSSRARSAPPRTADGPVVLLIGDVALAHDIGGLLAAKRLELKLTIVLVDNGGGGIFDFLPVSRRAMAAGARHLHPPHRHPARPRLRAGRRAVRPGPRARRNHPRVPRGAGAGALAQTGSAIVHVQTDRASNVELHRRIWAAVAHELDGARGGST